MFPLFVFSQTFDNRNYSVTNESITPVQEETADSLIKHLEPVVVNAFNRRQDLLQVPGTVSYIGNIVLERENPSINILPAFQYIPGVFAQQGATNTSRVIIRGTGARVPYATGKIRAYFNNIPLTDASGTTFIEDIDPSILESIEVIKGPAPSVYGAGLGGTIILNARNPEARRTGISNSTQAGEFGLLRNSTTIDWVNDNVASTLVYSHTQTDGYRENNQLRRDVITSVNQFNLLNNTPVTILLAYADGKAFIPSSVDSITYADNPRNAAANWNRTQGYEDGARLLTGINAEHKFTDLFALEVSLFGLWQDEKEMRPFDVYYQERSTLGTRFRFEHQNILNQQDVDVSYGGELFRENYIYSNHENIGGEGQQGDPLTDNRETVFSYNFFAQTDGDIGPFHFSSGVNANFTQRDYRDLFSSPELSRSGLYDYGIMISPRIALGYKLSDFQSVYASVSHGFSPPSLDETLTAEGFINPDILPEKSWNYELGLRGKLWKESLFYDFSLYRMQVTDLLVAQRVGEDAWVGKNAGESIHNGVEAELQWVILSQKSLGDRWLNELSIRTNATYNDFIFTDFIDREIDYSGNSIPGIPDFWTFSSIYFELKQGVYFIPSWNFTGSMAMNDANSRRSEPYHLVNFTLGYKPAFLSNFKLDVFIKGNNVFDEKYASMILVNAPSFGGRAPRYYYPGMPVHWLGGLKITI